MEPLEQKSLSIPIPSELLDYIDRRIDQKLAAIRDTPAVEQKPRFYSRKEVAQIFCISIPTLNRYVTRGILKSQRVGSRILFSQLNINEALHEIRK